MENKYTPKKNYGQIKQTEYKVTPKEQNETYSIELNSKNSKFCERMRVTGTNLHCGRHNRCFEPDICENVPEGITKY